MCTRRDQFTLRLPISDNLSPDSFRARSQYLETIHDDFAEFGFCRRTLGGTTKSWWRRKQHDIDGLITLGEYPQSALECPLSTFKFDSFARIDGKRAWRGIADLEAALE